MNFKALGYGGSRLWPGRHPLVLSLPLLTYMALVLRDSRVELLTFKVMLLRAL